MSISYTNNDLVTHLEKAAERDSSKDPENWFDSHCSTSLVDPATNCPVNGAVNTLWVVAKDILIDLFVERLRTVFALVKLQDLERIRPDVISEVIPAAECTVSNITDDLSDGLESSIVLWVLVRVPLSCDHIYAPTVSRRSRVMIRAVS
jgi:hypothetical protein